MEEYILSPGEILFNKNDTDAKLVFIIKGKIEFFDYINDKEFSISHCGVYFSFYYNYFNYI